MLIVPLILLLASGAAAITEPQHIAASSNQLPLAAALPPAPPPPPPFSRKTDAAARLLGARVSDAFRRCGAAGTNSNGRNVDAFGTPRHSPEWQKAAVALRNYLTVCRELRTALRSQKDFLLDLVQSGTRQDAVAARPRLATVSSDLAGLEANLSAESLRYRDLVETGWGNPHCASGPPSRFERPGSRCQSETR